MYSIGAKDKAMVEAIQEALHIVADGIFGVNTRNAVIRFQSNNNIIADGIVGRETLTLLGILDTDTKVNKTFYASNGLRIVKNHMKKGEYLENTDGTPLLNEYLFLHTTFGWHNPYNQISGWENDDRGAIGTEFLVGGQNIRNNDDTYDGQVLQAFPTGCQAWHLGSTGSYYMNRHSVGIEMCNFGYLDKFDRNYVNIIANPEQITELSEEFRGYTKWHKLSKRQIAKTKLLIEFIGERDEIDIRKGLVEWIHKYGVEKAFDFQQDAYEGKVKGLLSHSNVRKDKFDVHPQEEFVEMLINL